MKMCENSNLPISNVPNENAESYFDVSKYYVRGLNKGFNNLLETVSRVFLVRDPLVNMKSF